MGCPRSSHCFCGLRKDLHEVFKLEPAGSPGWVWEQVEWYLGQPHTCLTSCSPGSQVDVRTQVFPWQLTLTLSPHKGNIWRNALYAWNSAPQGLSELVQQGPSVAKRRKSLRSLLGTGLRMRGHGADTERELLQLSLPWACRSLLGNTSVPGVSANLWPFVPEFFDPGPCIRLHSDRCSLW